MKGLKFYILLLLIFSCKKLDMDIDHEIYIIGHGGAGLQSQRNQLPHNSFESIKKAIDQYGADGVEVDVQLSADGTLWLFHDETLIKMTDCQGCILNLTDNEIQKCKYRNEFSVNVLNTPFKLVKLIEVIEYFNSLTEFPFLLLDIKLPSVCIDSIDSYYAAIETLIFEIEKLINDYNFKNKIFILTSNREMLNIFFKKNTEFQLLYSGIFNPEVNDFLNEINAYGMVLKNENVNKEEIDELRLGSYKSMIYNAKSVNSIVSAVNKQADFLLTNNIPLTKNILNK